MPDQTRFTANYQDPLGLLLGLRWPDCVLPSGERLVVVVVVVVGDWDSLLDVAVLVADVLVVEVLDVSLVSLPLPSLLPLSLSPLPLLPPSSRGEERPGVRVVVVGLPSSPMCTTVVGSLFGTVLDVSVVSREVDSATASPSMVRVVSSSPVPVELPPRGVPAPPECAASSLFGPSSDGPASWARPPNAVASTSPLAARMM